MDRKQFLKCALYSSIAIIISPKNLLIDKKEKSLEEKLFPLYNEINSKFNLDDKEYALLVDGKNQKMYFVNEFDGFRISKVYAISTGKAGFGNEFGSGKTPTGIHKIKEKYGESKPFGTIFIARKDTGKIAEIHTKMYDSPNDLITSRIMWLDGCEKQNENSHSRYIYIHGTPEEGLIGTPVSHGCIRMKNKDVMELYELVNSGTYVNIKENIN